VADPEMMVTNGSVILSRWSSDEAVGPRDALALRFVLSSAISEIAADRSKRIQVTISEESQSSTKLLSSVGFRLDHSGTIFEKR
jgi:hypothetical protein